MRRCLILLALLVAGALVIVALLASPTDLGLQDSDTPAAMQLYSSDGVLLDEQPESADFVQYVRAQLLDDARFLGGDAAERVELLAAGGLVVQTTLNLEMQQATLAAGGGLWGRYWLPDGISFAVVSIEPDTGAIRIMADPWEGEAGEIPANLSTDLRREPSGVFKGLTMVAAVQTGIGPEDVVSGPIRRWHPASVLRGGWVN